MDIAIMVSTKDAAGLNIKEHLLKRGFDETDEEYDSHKVYRRDSTKLFTTDSDTVDCEHIDDRLKKDGFSPGLIIFATRHQSASGVDSLSVHSPGNWGKAEFGGEDKRLCIAPARILKAALLKIEDEAKAHDLEYDIIQECTHHGPAMDTPVMFIEIGSALESWKNPQAGDALAATIIFILDNMDTIPQCMTAFGIGGPHHTPSFTKVMHRTDICFGHVCPKYMLQDLDEGLILQAIDKTSPKAGIVVLDWKGLGKEKGRIKEILEGLDIPFKRAHDLQG